MAKILYIGRFELPDKEATANRVVANAKLLRSLGHEVVLAGWSEEVSTQDGWRQSECFGFTCYEKHKAKTSYEKYKMFSDATPELLLLKKGAYDTLLAYDFPAVALKKLMRYCKKHGIRVICDVSEWYTNGNKNPLFRVVRAYDSYLRMKVLHKRADGLIVISKYLESYYSDCKTVRIPPLVDMDDPKWEVVPKDTAEGKTRLIYAGWPSKTKERLDIIVDAVAAHADVVELDVYGIDEKRYREIYEETSEISPNVVFHGRVSHLETVAAVKRADFSVIIRESCRKNNAGFPSKLVESIACGTPALITDISNVRDYVGDGKNGYIVSLTSFDEDLRKIIHDASLLAVDRRTFEYRNFKNIVQSFFEGL